MTNLSLIRTATRPQVVLMAVTQFIDPGSPLREALSALPDPPESTPPGHFRGTDQEALVEYAGRMCYQSFEKGRPSEEYHSHIVEVGHGSVLEHINFTFQITGVTRYLTHELVRHRTGVAFSQMSTRFIDARKSRMVLPQAMANVMQAERAGWLWRRKRAFKAQLESYVQTLVDLKRDSPGLPKKQRLEAARHDAPSDIETGLICTMNLRCLLHFLRQRGSQHAAAEIRALAFEVWRQARPYAPSYLDGIRWHAVEYAGPLYTDNVPRVSP